MTGPWTVGPGAMAPPARARDVSTSGEGRARPRWAHGAGELALLGTPEIRGFPLLRRRLLAKRLNAAGPLTADAVAALATALADRFPPA